MWDREETVVAYEKKQNLKYEIINHIGTLSISDTGWQTELNRVSWNGREPKYDLRSWSPDHTKMGKGITLSEKEIISLEEILREEVRYLEEN